MAFKITTILLLVTLGSAAIETLGSDLCSKNGNDGCSPGYYKSGGQCKGIETFWNDLGCGTTSFDHNYEDKANRLKRYIAGGQEALKYGWPWMALVGDGCTGAIISPYHVLTARHCVELWTADTVTVGVHDFASDSKDDVAQKIDIKRHYSAAGRADVVVLELSEKIEITKKVFPICLPSRDDRLKIGEKTIIAGWGDTAENVHSSYLKDGQVYYAGRPNPPSRLCKETVCFTSEHQIKLLPLTHGSFATTCKGDSGSPTFKKQPNGKWATYGVLSGGKGKCEPGSGVTNTFEYVPEYVDWIRESMEKLDKTIYCTEQKKKHNYIF